MKIEKIIKEWIKKHGVIIGDVRVKNYGEDEKKVIEELVAWINKFT